MGDAADADRDAWVEALACHHAGHCGNGCPWCYGVEGDDMAERVLESGEVVEDVVPTHALVAAVPPRRALITREAIREEAEQRQLLNEYVKSQMVPGVDFGAVPGTSRMTLLKPGAEKLTELFRCTPEFVCESKTEDWDRPLFAYGYKCRIVFRETGQVIAEGVGACNSMEGKYRWRNANRKCPACGKEAVIKGKAEYGGGWLCFKKKDGCGAKWADGAPEIEGQPAGKVENDDVYDQQNTILKMAKKRAHVDAAIALARVSDLFTQDVGDPERDDPERDDPGPAAEPPRAAPRGAKVEPAEPPAGSVSAAQAKTINALIHTLRAAGRKDALVGFLRYWSGRVKTEIPEVTHLPAACYDEAVRGLNNLISSYGR